MDSIARLNLIALEREYGWGSKPPTYVEAYPVLNVAEARRAARSGRSMCFWRDGRRLVAVATVDLAAGDRLTVRLAEPDLLLKQGIRPVGSYEFVVVYKGSQENNKRPLLICPACDRARSGLVLISRDWRCQECHGLHYRSALVGTVVRRAEKYARLARELKQLRLESRRADLIRRKRAEVAAALRKAGPLPHREANGNYSTVVRSEWRRGEFAARGSAQAEPKQAKPERTGRAAARAAEKPTFDLTDWMTAAGFGKPS